MYLRPVLGSFFVLCSGLSCPDYNVHACAAILVIVVVVGSITNRKAKRKAKGLRCCSGGVGQGIVLSKNSTILTRKVALKKVKQKAPGKL
ncbi:hypothetical protein F4859DRAFT_428868 [Xylaria cf. heliscus]|nr:hypothetical protein F4859DRAFT_428868 [Xylaria cf. heliscus]